MTLVMARKARTLSQPGKFGSVPFFTPDRVATLIPLLNLDESNVAHSADPRISWEWNNRVMGTSLQYTPQGPLDPFSIPQFYDGEDVEEPSAELDIVDADFPAAVDLAVRYLVLGESAAAEAVATILAAWSNIASFGTNSGSTFRWVSKWPLMIQAAMMIRDHEAYTAQLHEDLVDVTQRTLLLMNEPLLVNNHGSWGACFWLASAVFLEDRELFKRAILRWRLLFNTAIKNNIPINEIYRQGGIQGDGRGGLTYSNFNLYAMTVTAEWARFNGEWLYDYTGSDGSTFREHALLVRHWSRYPNQFPYNSSGTPSQTVRTYPHDDILHALWPDEDSAWLLANFPTGGSMDLFGIRQHVLAYRGRPLYG